MLKTTTCYNCFQPLDLLKRADAKWCSPACRQRARRRQKREGSVKYDPSNADMGPLAADDFPFDLFARYCEICLDRMPGYWAHRRRYCSNRCRQRAYRARHNEESFRRLCRWQYLLLIVSYESPEMLADLRHHFSPPRNFRLSHPGSVDDIVPMRSLDEPFTMYSEESDRLTLIDTVEDVRAQEAFAAVIEEEATSGLPKQHPMSYGLEDAIGCLREREQLVIRYVIHDRLTFLEISEKMGVTVFRLHWIYKWSIQQLRNKLQSPTGGRDDPTN